MTVWFGYARGNGDGDIAPARLITTAGGGSALDLGRTFDGSEIASCCDIKTDSAARFVLRRFGEDRGKFEVMDTSSDGRSG